MKPDPAILPLLLHYEPETGRLFWKIRAPDLYPADGEHSAEYRAKRWNSRRAGKQAFTHVREDGYRYGSVMGYTVAAHRIILAMAEGKWPDQVDHINGDRTDDRLCNLRSVTRSENMRNLSCRNPSGAIGVYRYRDGVRWYASMHLGVFDTFEEARAAREKAQRDLGYHPNHGRNSTDLQRQLQPATDGKQAAA